MSFNHLIVVVLAALLVTGCAEEAVPIEGRPQGAYRLLLDSKAIDDTRHRQLTTTLTRRADSSPVTGLQVLHERVLHNFIVARDFSSFAHIHHEDFQPLSEADLAAARFTFPYRFPRDGDYRMVSEFTVNDRSHTRHFDFSVGNTDRTTTPQPDLRRTKAFDNYRVDLTSIPGIPVAGFETHLELTLQRDGEPVTDLALILGSELHLACWRLDGEYFGHAHSYTAHMAAMNADMHDREVAPNVRAARMQEMMIAMRNVEPLLEFPGPRVPLRYVFPTPGVYVMFAHMAPGGESRYFDFMVEVAAPADSSNHNAADHGNPDL